MKPCYAVLISVLLGAAASTQVSGCRPEGPVRLPNVIIISADTLRADHLGCYGYYRDTSPNIDAFARRATLYPNSIAASPWTLPTHVSMFSGLYPFEHGVHNYKVSDDTIDAPPVPQDVPLLAEVLKSEGYATGAIIGNENYLIKRYDVHRGFDTFFSTWLYAHQINYQALPWIDRYKDKPFFLFINYVDTHRPYNTVPRPGLLDRPVDQSRLLFRELRLAVMPGTDPVPQDLAQRLIDQYDTSIANLDEEFVKVIELLEDRGIYDDTLIIFTSDHGECFGEHHLVAHNNEVYQTSVEAPFILKRPRQRRGEVCEDLVNSVDIPRMVLSEISPELAEKYRDVFPREPGNHPVLAEKHVSDQGNYFHKVFGHRFRRKRTALIELPYKFIESGDGAHELYDIEADPGELKNLYEDRAELAEGLWGRLKAFQAGGPREIPFPFGHEELTTEDKKRMEALGYL